MFAKRLWGGMNGSYLEAGKVREHVIGEELPWLSELLSSPFRIGLVVVLESEFCWWATERVYVRGFG